MICKAIFKRSLVFAMAIGLVLLGDLRNPAQVSTGSEFNINKVPIVKPKLGKFPYFSLIDGYEPGNSFYGQSKDVAFDRYEFFDGTKFITVEGRLQTIIARGKGASPYEILKTYESLVKDLGGVSVFEGRTKVIYNRGLDYKERRSRRYTLEDDLFGVYMIRMPDKEIWVEAYTVDDPITFIGYQLTVVEKKALNVRATLLTAEEMKKELDSKGRVNLDIDFEDDKSDIKPKSQAAIDETVKLMKNNPRLNLTVRGSSDKTGTRENNRKLSEARANSVVRALTARGISARRLKAVGAGQNKATGDRQEAAAGTSGVELVKDN
jgi:OmpA-OmpF porin, OOP family